LRSDVFEKSRYLSQPDTFRNHGELERPLGQTPTSEATVMNKTLLYMAPIALVGLLGTDTAAKAAVWNGSLAPNIVATTAEQTDAPFVLVRGGRGGGGGGRGGGGGFRGGGGGGRGGGYAGARGGGGRGGGGGSWAGAGRGNFSGGNRANFAGGNRANVGSGNRTFNQGNRNVNVSGNYGGGYGGGYGWGGVAAGVAAGAVVGAAATSAAYPAYYAAPVAAPYCPYPDYPNCGL
jgi:hypothetical protein